MWKKEFYRGTEKREHVDKMKKSDLRFELENMRDEYDKSMLKQEICRMIDRMTLASDLRKVRDYTELVYKEFATNEHWWRIHGMKDNIVSMVENLSEQYQAGELQYWCDFMYGRLSRSEELSKALTECVIVTDGMRECAEIVKGMR